MYSKYQFPPSMIRIDPIEQKLYMQMFQPIRDQGGHLGFQIGKLNPYCTGYTLFDSEIASGNISTEGRTDTVMTTWHSHRDEGHM